jgi:hypothetical protein
VSNLEDQGEFSRKSVPSPGNKANLKSKKGKKQNDNSRGNSANILRSPALAVDLAQKQASYPVSTIKKTMNDNSLPIGRIPAKNYYRNDTDEESAQFEAKPSDHTTNNNSYLEVEQQRLRLNPDNSLNKINGGY